MTNEPVPTEVEVSVSDARAQLSDLVDRAEAGQVSYLSRHGRRAAAIVPVDLPEQAATARSRAFARKFADPFVDGNKRTGLVATLDFLDRTGIETEPLDDQLAYELTMGVAAGRFSDVDDIAAGLRACLGREAPHWDRGVDS